MDDIFDKMMGFDKKNEIFNLWYEVNFLRLALNEVLKLNPSLHENLSEEIMDKCRKDAQDIVVKRFPNCNIKFNKTATESTQEHSCCTPPDPSETPPSSPSPLNAA